jgi:hypothetical protein
MPDQVINRRNDLPTLFRDVGGGVYTEISHVVMRGWNTDTLDSQMLKVDPVTGGLVVAGLTGGGGVVGGLTNTELRAVPVPVSGPLTDAQIRAVALPVSGPLTDAQLRAAAVPVSIAAVPLPAGAATEATLAAVRDRLPAALDVDGGVKVHVGNLAATQAISAVSLPLPAGATTEATLSGLSAKLPAALVGGRLSVDVGASVTVPVSGTFWQLTQPVSVATLPLPAGAATEATLAGLSAKLPTALVAGSLPIDLDSIAGVPLAAVALPANAAGQTAVPVTSNAIQYATYKISARAQTTGALVANTAKQILSLEHAATATKRVRVRRIMLAGYGTDAVLGMVDVQLTRGVAASTAGTAIVPGPAVASDPAAEVVAKALPTIVAATVVGNLPWGVKAAVANAALPTSVVYDWQESGETKALQLRPGVLESLVISLISNAANTIIHTIEVTVTED